jgi:hypothetical protein
MRVLVAISLLISSIGFAATKAPKVKVKDIVMHGVTFKGAAAKSLNKLIQLVEGGKDAIILTRNKTDPNVVHLYANDGDSKDWVTFRVKNNVRKGAFTFNVANPNE